MIPVSLYVLKSFAPVLYLYFVRPCFLFGGTATEERALFDDYRRARRKEEEEGLQQGVFNEPIHVEGVPCANLVGVEAEACR